MESNTEAVESAFDAPGLPDDSAFVIRYEQLPSKFEELMRCGPVRYSQLPRSLPREGVYVFTEHGQHLYVGRTNNLRNRLANHCRPSGTHFTATFAFRIARQTTGKLKASYKKTGSRAELLLDPAFNIAFETAKRRLADMDIRWISESDAITQSLLEIYTALRLRTPFNDFDNH